MTLIQQKRKRGHERGQGMLEYILIVVLVVIVGIAAWQKFGERIKDFVRGAQEGIDAEVCNDPDVANHMNCKTTPSH